VNKLKEKLSYANVMATLAVFMVLGGGAYAAVKIPKKSVGTKQLKAKAVSEAKLGDGAVSAVKLKTGAAVKKVVYREVVHENTNASFSDDIQCAAGEEAVGGGVLVTGVGNRSTPNNDVDVTTLANGPIDASGQAVSSGQVATGWHVSADVLIGTKDLHLYAACAQK
jgi:hypothetical protein